MRSSLVLVVLLLASCASASRNVRLSSNQLIGTYYRGDGIGPGETLVLHANGTFTSTIAGDLIVKPTSFYGTWSLNGERITFRDSYVRPGSPPMHTFAITQMYKRHVVLLPGEYANSHSVSYSQLYSSAWAMPWPQ